LYTAMVSSCMAGLARSCPGAAHHHIHRVPMPFLPSPMDQPDAPSAPRHAGRPRVTLTDAQARILVQQLGPIKERHENNPRQHRPFVADFVRAVYHATGRTHSAGFYRKLLVAFAPGRTPSTPTIEIEKNLLEHELGRAALADNMGEPTVHADSELAGLLPVSATAAAFGIRPDAPRATDPAQLQAIGLLQHLARKLELLERAPAGADPSAGLQAHNDYLRERLASVEAELATMRTLAARMTASAQEEAGLAAERGRQLEALHARAAEQAAALAAIAATADGDRKFFAMQVDGVRCETRAARERCAQLEQVVKEREQQMEMYRQMAYSKGAVPR
jgi:hypothetical protein